MVSQVIYYDCYNCIRCGHIGVMKLYVGDAGEVGGIRRDSVRTAGLAAGCHRSDA